MLKSHRAFTHIPKSQGGDQENGFEPKPLQPKTGDQLFDIRVQYPHIQIQGASVNPIEKADKELNVNPEDYPHIKINFLP